MKKICQKALAVFFAVLMLTTGIIPVMAETPVGKIIADDDFFAGVATDITAQVSGLTKEEADYYKDNNICFEWLVSGADSGNLIAGKKNLTISSSNDVYTITEEAKLTPSISSVSQQVSVSATLDGKYVCETEITPLQPIEKIDIEQVNDNSHSYYDLSSSTLYIDYYKNEDEKAESYAELKVTASPNENNDFLEIPSSNNKFNSQGKECISCELDSESGNYKVTASQYSEYDSLLTFSPASGYSSQNIVKIKKCVPLTRFHLSVNGQVYAGTDIGAGSLSVIEGDTIKIDVTNTLPISGLLKFNDSIDYKVYTDEKCTKELDSSKYTIKNDEDNLGCSLTIKNPGLVYVKAYAKSRDVGMIDRTLNCVMPVTITQLNAITDIKLTENEYTIYTLNKTTIDLSKETTFTVSTPGSNPTDEILYESDNPDVATVNSSGLVTAHNSGSAKITLKAKRGSGICTCTVNVVAAIKSIELKADSQVLPLGHKATITLIASPDNTSEKIYWSSSNEKALTVDNNGNIEAVEDYNITSDSETVTVTAVSESGASKSIQIAVVPAVRATNLELEPSNVGNSALMPVSGLSDTYSIYNGDTISVNCKMTGENGKASNDTVLWRAKVGANAEVDIEDAKDYIDCTVNADSVQIKSKTNNDITLTAYAVKAGQSYFDAVIYKSIIIKSNDKTTAITFTPSNATKLIPAGTTYPFTVSLTPNSDYNKDSVIVVSDNESVATVQTVFDESTKTAYVTVNAKENGTAKITCYACYDKENYQTTYVKTKVLTVTVTNNIAAADVSGIGNVAYKGSAYTINDFPALNVVFGNTTLIYNTDYSVTFANNTNVGTATATITGKSNTYQGTKVIEFNIEPKQMDASTVQVTASTVTYNGTALSPNVTVKDLGRSKTLTKGTDYYVTYSNNVNAGTGYVTITGMNNYAGSYTTAFAINPLAISSGNVKVSAISAMTATGAPLTPIPTVTYNGATLIYGVDYTMSYANNVKAGTATATIIGMGNFTGSRNVSFTISAAPAPAPTVKTVKLSSTKYTYDGKVKAPTVTATDSNGKTLRSGTDYTVSYASGRKSVGTYAVKITFKGNYSGSKTLYFTIVPKSTSISSVTAKSKGFTVKWKKQSTQTTGYQIQYSTSSKFTSKTTKSVTVSKNKTVSKAISKLKSKKKYYVRIRTYKTVKVNGKSTKIYSSWSKVKTVKTK